MMLGVGELVQVPDAKRPFILTAASNVHYSKAEDVS